MVLLITLMLSLVCPIVYVLSTTLLNPTVSNGATLPKPVLVVVLFMGFYVISFAILHHSSVKLV